jgi:hypothetical protein
MEGQYTETTTPIARPVLQVILEGVSVWVCEAASIYAVARTVVISMGGYFLGVEMAGDDWHTGADGIIVGRMKTALITVFNDCVAIYVEGPTTLPFWEVVRKRNAVNILKLRSNLSKAGFKSGIVIAEGPELCCLAGGLVYLTKAYLTDLKLLLDGRYSIPSDWWVATDRTAIENIAVQYNDIRSKFLTELDEGPVPDWGLSRPIVHVTSYENYAVLQLNLFSPLHSPADLCGLLAVVNGGFGYSRLSWELS